MKDIERNIQYEGRDLTLVFNLNVMEQIQEEYGTLDAWADLTDGSSHEPNAKAIIFGFCQMLNEGIDIQNEKDGTSIPPFTLRQTGRIITRLGLQTATDALNETVIDSTRSAEKNG